MRQIAPETTTRSAKVVAEFFEYVVVECTSTGKAEYLVAEYKRHECCVAEKPGKEEHKVDAFPRRAGVVM